MARQGGVLPVMFGTNKLVLNVNIDFTHIPYPKYFGMILGCVTEGQKRQPGVNAGKVTLIGETRRYCKSQFVMIAFLAPVIANPAPKRPVGLIDLCCRLPGKARWTHRVIHQEFEGKIAPNQWKPKTVRRIGIRNHSTTKRVHEAATEENMEECTAISHC